MKDEKSKMREIKASDYKYKPITPPEPPQIDCDGTETLSPEEQYSLPLLPDEIIEQEIPPERPQIDYDGTETLSPEEQYSLPLLPDDFIEQEILSQLPVKSLLRFRCVSKSWRSIIDSSWFVENHYRNSTKNTSLAHHRVIFNWKFQETRQCSLQSMLDRTSVHPSPFDEEADNKSITRYAYIMGCCNGLFYLVTYNKGHFFWNPATKKFFKLPQIAKNGLPFYSFRRILKRGFCWDETASAYKVFAVLFDPRVRRNVARVYSSKMNSWTAVKVGSLSLYDEVGVHVNGYFHWIAKKNGNHPCYIETFDLRRRRFGKIGMPLGEVDGFSNLRLGEVRGCIALLREVDRDTDLWIMKEHGVEESWEKLVRVRGYCYEGRRLFSTPCGERVLVAGRNFLAFRDGNGVARSKRISHGEEEAKSEEGRKGWFSGLKDLLRSCYEDCYPSIRGKDYFNYHTYFYVESLVLPFPTTSC